MKAAWQSAAGIVLVTLVVYFPALRAGFVWDDDLLITGNSMVKADDGLYRFWFTTEARDYYPLTSSAWWLQWRLWGNNPTGWHAVNVLLHAVNALLVWIVLRRLKLAGAWWAALAFALHPVNVATAAWISEQKNTLSMLFSLVAVLVYLKFDKDDRWRWYGLSLASFALALLSKTAVVMLPVALLGCLWWRHGTVKVKDLIRTGPFFALSLVLGLVTVWFQQHRVLQGQVVGPGSFLDRLLMAGCVPWFYLYKTLWPFHLSAVYPRWDIRGADWRSYLPAIALAAGWTLLWWKRKTWGRGPFFTLGYFVVMLFPVMGFFDQSFYVYSFVADPWLYFPILGVIAWVAGAVAVLGKRMEGRQDFGPVLGVVALTGLGVLTWDRTHVYRTGETLWRDTVTRNPVAWMPHYNLGSALLATGRFREAIVPFEEAARLRPDAAKVHSNLGIALAQAGRLSEAQSHLEWALRLDPQQAEVHANLGHLLMLLGRTPEAIEHWEQALQINSGIAELHYDLGLAYEQTGKRDAARQHFERAVKLKPDFAEARNKLADR